MKLFYSYSHKDLSYADELRDHLSILVRKEVLSEWIDHKILPGYNWRIDVDDNLDYADVIILLISSHFLASDFCFDSVLKKSIARQAAGEVVVMPILLRHCDWEDSPFGILKVFPTGGIPIESNSWSNRDEAYLNVVRDLKRIILDGSSNSSKLLTELKESNSDKNFKIDKPAIVAEESIRKQTVGAKKVFVSLPFDNSNLNQIVEKVLKDHGLKPINGLDLSQGDTIREAL